jgi:protein TonB
MDKSGVRSPRWGRAMWVSAAIHVVGVALLYRMRWGDAPEPSSTPVTVFPVSWVSPAPIAPPVRVLHTERPVEWTPERALPTHSPIVAEVPPAAPDTPLAEPSSIRPAPRSMDYSLVIPDQFAISSGEERGGGVASELPQRAEGESPRVGSVGAHPLTDIRPLYPRNARREGLEGVVTIQAKIGEKGDVEGVEVRESSGVTSLDEAALTAVRRASFKPAIQGGRPVPSLASLRFRFQLTDLQSSSPDLP